jgi:activating signal cointegrator complex subunit 1
MDIMRPQLLQIGSICYRKNPVENSHTGDRDDDDKHHVMSMIEDVEDYAPLACASEYSVDDQVGRNIEKTGNGYRLGISVPSVLYGFIVGRGGETKKRIETETKTKITIPRQGISGDVVIEGSEQGRVLSASSRISLLAETARAKQPFTHFISLPIASEAIRNGFEDFKRDVLDTCEPDEGIDDSIFQTPNKLHLTIGMLTLLDANEVLKATQLLTKCREMIIDDILYGNPLELEVQGLEYMNDDPDKVDVLYAKVAPVDGSQMLQNLAEKLVDTFVSAGLMKREYNRVKLHITVINSIKRNKMETAQGKGVETSLRKEAAPMQWHRPRDRRESFRASRIMEFFGDFSFGTHRLDSIHVSQRNFTGQDGYYAPAGIIRLP